MTPCCGVLISRVAYPSPASLLAYESGNPRIGRPSVCRIRTMLSVSTIAVPGTEPSAHITPRRIIDALGSFDLQLPNFTLGTKPNLASAS
jgi:hypothetical protein